MKPTESIEHLRRFVDLQERLWDAFRQENPGRLAAGLMAFPKQGRVRLDGKEWDFYTHGSGVTFSELAGPRRVDLHDALAGPQVVDAWRLATYFGALGRSGEKVVRKVAGVSDSLEKRISEWLEELARRGVLRPEGRGYRFERDIRGQGGEADLLRGT